MYRISAKYFYIRPDTEYLAKFLAGEWISDKIKNIWPNTAYRIPDTEALTSVCMSIKIKFVKENVNKKR